MSKNEKTGAIIVAAGFGQRMEGIDKIKAYLGGEPVLARVVDIFQDCSAIDRIVVVVRPENIEFAQRLKRERAWSKVTDIVPGGEKRRDSVAAGLSRLERCDWIIVHDGARPLVTTELIEQGLAAARETGAAIAAIPITDTIKLGKDNVVERTLPRHDLWAVQTPQVFRFDIIESAYRKVRGDATDDAALVEQMDYPVKIYLGSYDNIKITISHDLVLAEILLQERVK
ncbi:MAG: 2-C-methyl-D-erythritol 4-phosphate cytidylyltransferase [Chloroflexi bacterium]|nr:2-C-methyl-D-erythritol 4-phosphate cytidylyltransferase [Chloroflexota bacterium]